MSNNKLGPCPLCSGEATSGGFDYDRGEGYATCTCGLDVPISVWQALSALAAQNRRRNLEWSALLKLIEWHGGGRIIDDIDDENETWRKCMEWAEEDRRKKNA